MLLNKRIIILLTMLILLLGPNYSVCQKGQVRCSMGYSISSFQDVDPVDATAAIAVYVESAMNMLQKKLNKKIEFNYKIFSSLDDMRKALKEKSVDLLSLSPLEFYELRKEFNIRPYIATRVNDDIFDQYYLVSHNDTGIKSINDVSGKSLSIPIPKYHVMMEEWLTVLLSENKLKKPEDVFKKIKIVKKESNAIYEVFFKQSDCAIIRKSVFNTLCELNPQIKQKLKVIISSEPIVLIISAISDYFDQELVKVYLENALMSSEGLNTGNILKIFKAKSFAKLKEEDMRTSKKLVDAYNSLISKRKEIPKSKLK